MDENKDKPIKNTKKDILRIAIIVIVGIVCCYLLLILSNDDTYTPVFVSRYRNWAWHYSDEITILYKDGHSVNVDIGKFGRDMDNDRAVKLVTEMHRFHVINSTKATKESKTFVDYILLHEDILAQNMEFNKYSIGNDMGNTTDYVVYNNKSYEIYSFGDWVYTPKDEECFNTVRDLFSILGTEVYNSDEYEGLFRKDNNIREEKIIEEPEIDHIWNMEDTIYVVVEAIDDYNAILRPIDGSHELEECDIFEVSLDGILYDNSMPEVGTNYKIVYQAGIVPTYPAHFRNLVSKNIEEIKSIQEPKGLNFGLYSFNETRDTIARNISSIQIDNFKNTEEIEISSLGELIEHAKNELTIDYDTMEVDYDSRMEYWRIYFHKLNVEGGGQFVYLNRSGVTRLIEYEY